nr:MAG TPA: hypothetical protein [Caudoviricetes sp.]
MYCSYYIFFKDQKRTISNENGYFCYKVNRYARLV